MEINQDFKKYIGGLSEIAKREKLEEFYATHFETIQFFKAIDKYVQDILGKPVVGDVLKQLETTLPRLVELKKEITFLDPKLSVAYKSEIVQVIGYIDNEMSISEVNDTHKQFVDLLKKNKQAFNTEDKLRLEAEAIEAQYNRLILAKNKPWVTEQDYQSLAIQFREMNGYKDTEELAKECVEQYRMLKEKEKKEKYQKLLQEYEEASTEQKFQKLATKFRNMNGYENSEGLAKECDNNYNMLQEDRIQALKTSRERIAKFQGCITGSNVHTVGLKINGTVVAVGYNKYGQCNTDRWRKIIAISAEFFRTFVLKDDGTVVAVSTVVGNDKYNSHVTTWRDIVAIASMGDHAAGLKTDGTVVMVGDIRGQRNVSNWHDIIAISTGHSHTVGLKANGTVIADGKNEEGQCNVSNWHDIVAVSAGGYHTVGLKADGTAVAVGNNKYNGCNVSDWRDIVAISAGAEHTVGLKADGTVVTVGTDESGRCNVSGWRNIVAIFAGYLHTVGLKADGTVVAVGSNEYGQCNVSNWHDIGPVDKENFKKGGCFIATTCYGNYNAPEVMVLRIYRDEYLLPNFWGRLFVKFYYFVSPPLAQFIEKSDKTKNFIRKKLLSPIVRRINQKLTNK